MSEIKNKTFEDKRNLLGNTLLKVNDILSSDFRRELESLSPSSMSMDKKLLLFSLYHLMNDDYLFYNFKMLLKEKVAQIAECYYFNFGLTDFRLCDLPPQDLPRDL